MQVRTVQFIADTTEKSLAISWCPTEGSVPLILCEKRLRSLGCAQCIIRVSSQTTFKLNIYPALPWPYLH